MTITVNIGQIVINIGQPSTESHSPENPTIVQPAVGASAERKSAERKSAERKSAERKSAERKSEIELASMATYRFRLSEKIRQLFGDETANHFLAGSV
ncbi:hypothetical protein ACNFCI_03715 [Pseudomonas sp. NY15356]|uniref:hypothetical protein n=1 Tax=Pseudomonas sp. NY15356 TaxID=3400352 RepID=UPI003A8683C1